VHEISLRLLLRESAASARRGQEHAFWEGEEVEPALRVLFLRSIKEETTPSPSKQGSFTMRNTFHKGDVDQANGEQLFVGLGTGGLGRAVRGWARVTRA